MRDPRLIWIWMCWLGAATAFGFRPVSVELEGPMANIALKGYDPVAYFTENRAVRGRAILQTEWSGARWYFSSPRHRRLFEAQPEKYAPAFGGYCAYCVSTSGDAATAGNPEIFLLHEGRLFLLQSEAVREAWMEDIDLHTRAAAEAYERMMAEYRKAAEAEAEKVPAARG